MQCVVSIIGTINECECVEKRGEDGAYPGMYPAMTAGWIAYFYANVSTRPCRTVALAWLARTGIAPASSTRPVDPEPCR